MADTELFISKLENRLLNPLPGPEVQYKMAPPDRDLRHLKFLENPSQQAAVLIILFQNDHRISTVFIKRTIDPGPHSGQISFPGGKSDSSDPSLIYTALRESHEEIGIDHKKVRLLGKLTPLLIPVSNFEVHPFVGYIDAGIQFRIQPEEVQFLISVPVEKLMEAETFSSMIVTIQNKDVRVPCFKVQGYNIWGATAMILREFLEVWLEAGLNSGR